MNIFATTLARVQAAIDALVAERMLPAGLDRTRVTVEPAGDPERYPAFGDMTTNAALTLARETGRAPRDLAEAIALRLGADALVGRAEVAGPGFINVTLCNAAWTEALRAILRRGAGAAGSAPRKPANGDTNLFKIKYFYETPHLTNEVDGDAVRFLMAFHAHGSARNIDVANANEQSYANPAFNVQYGHARARALYGRARDTFQDLPVDPSERTFLLQAAPLELLTHERERALVRRIAQYPHMLEIASIAGEPQHLAVYLHDLAGAFHTHSRLGIATPHLRFIIQNDRELTVARLALVEAVVIILAAGLAVLGVGAPDEMR